MPYLIALLLPFLNLIRHEAACFELASHHSRKRLKPSPLVEHKNESVCSSTPFSRNSKCTSSLNRGGAFHTTSALHLSKTSSEVSIATSYHLLWTPGFAKKVAFTTIALLFSQTFLTGKSMFTNLSRVLDAPWISTLGLSLLASSCCLIQLLANILVGTVGCLGLNTALGPSRPYFLSFLLFLTFSTSPKVLPEILLRFVIAFLPEAIFFFNKRGSILGAKNNKSQSMPANGGMVATMEFDIPTMGCIACINKIDSSLRNELDQEKVINVSSQLDPARPKGGSAKVTLNVSSEEEAKAVRQLVIDVVGKAGFGGSSISKLEMSNTNSGTK